VEVEADGIGRYPQETEAAVYFCVLEALQNVQKYADASAAAVHLEEQDGELRFQVDDDGRGFDREGATKGSGLQNMEDRLDALGGRLQISSSPGHGVNVTGAIPVQVEVRR
jgi:signal transduction histidine kinase